MQRRIFEALALGRWISYILCLNFQNSSFQLLRRKQTLCWYFGLESCHNLSPSSCCLSPFCLPYVAVSRLWRLSDYLRITFHRKLICTKFFKYDPRQVRRVVFLLYCLTKKSFVVLQEVLKSYELWAQVLFEKEI